MAEIAEFLTSIAVLLGGFAYLIRELRISRKQMMGEMKATRKDMNGLKDELVARTASASFAKGEKSEHDKESARQKSTGETP